MKTVSSHDGTTIAHDKVGEGPTLILVDGALSVHSSGGKPEPPYAGREIEDIEALIDHAGDLAFLYDHSSGGTVAFRPW